MTNMKKEKKVKNIYLLQFGRLVILLCSDTEQHISGFLTAANSGGTRLSRSLT